MPDLEGLSRSRMTRRTFCAGAAGGAVLAAVLAGGSVLAAPAIPAVLEAARSGDSKPRKEDAMELTEALFTRRSIRKFTDKPLSREDIETVLRAAMIAPSAGNAQPWEFLVLTDRAVLDAIPEISPYAAMCRTAQAAVLVCADLAHEKFPGYWVIDCAAAIQNMLLAARGMGIGTCWTGIHPMEDRIKAFSDRFKLPQTVRPHSLIAMGWPDAEFKRMDRYKPERIHYGAY